MSKDDKKQFDAFKRLSKVTPKSSTSLFQTPVFKAVLGLCLLFVLISYVSSGSQAKAQANNETNSSKTTTSTLNQNLAYLSQLKEKQTNDRRLEEQRLRHELEVAQNAPVSIPTNSTDNIPKIDRALQARMKAETTFINVDYKDQVNLASVTNQQTITQSVVSSSDKNSQFINQNNQVGLVKAYKLQQPNYTLASGELIEATLETAINSQLPGMVRAIVSRDIYSLNGKRLLIPKGAGLIGQYATGQIGQSQNRILITWTRVQLSNGVMAMLNSPSTDSLGRAGLGADNINHHFLQRFGTSALFSVLGAYTANSGVNGMDGYNSASLYRMSLAQSFQKTASDTLNKNANTPPTLNIHQGHKINVFVARDINFYDAMREVV